MPDSRNETRPASASPTKRHGHAKRAAAFAAVLLAILAAGRLLAEELARIPAWLDGLGPWGPAAFIVVYAIATVALGPGSILTLAAGALFGLAAGTLYTLVAATLGATLAFLVSRYAVRGLVEKRLAESPRFAALDRALAREGRRIGFLLRLSPVFPFNVLNYALGATDVRLLEYLIASIGMLPGTLLYVYYGKAGGDVARAAGGIAPERGVAYYAWVALGLAATIAVTAYVARLAKRALAESAATNTAGNDANA